MDKSMAEAENRRGNAFYKEGKYTKAAKCFAEASKLDPKEPKYVSNHSAVLYELGRYPAAIRSIHLAWSRLRRQHGVNGTISTPPASNSLAIKLATRLAKAKINGYCSRTISLHARTPTKGVVIKQEIAGKRVEADIEFFANTMNRVDHGEVKVQEMKSSWKHWQTIRGNCSKHGAEECEADVVAAEMRMRRLPIFKSASDPTLEYYTFGHDDVRSLLHGLNGSNAGEYRLNGPEFATQTDWSFLLGGSGDARHMFGTLIHFSDRAHGFGSQSMRPLKVHMTLMDVHPASLARVIVVLALLRQILHARLTKNKFRCVELYATLFYLYTTVIMPDYCCEIIMETANNLLNDLPRGVHRLSKCLHIHIGSLPAILDVLHYWSKSLKKSTRIHLKSMASNTYSDDVEATLASMMGRLNTKEPLRRVSAKTPVEPMDVYNDHEFIHEVEKLLFKSTQVLFPPRSLIWHHPALAELLVKFSESAPDNLYENVRREVEQTWKPNPTLFDRTSTEHPELSQIRGYPSDATNPLDTVHSFLEFITKLEPRSARCPLFCKGMTSFELTSRFFNLVADAVWDLQDNLKVEMIVSDVIAGVPKLVTGELGYRPKEFPHSYTRMWLSNVPDYTHGILNTAVHLVPHLQPGQMAMSNCLLNTNIWPNISEICHNYTLLLPRDVPRFLGCQLIMPDSDMGVVWDDIVLKQLPLPRPLSELASKKDLHSWLARLLLCILCNGISPPPPSRINLPTNLGGFLQVLVHLHRVGFPSHWIGDFLQSVVSDNLVTDAELYLGHLPIPSATRKMEKSRRVHLNAWQADLQVILATSMTALPFSVNMPSEYPSCKDISIYSAIVQPLDLKRHPLYRLWAPLSAPFAQTVGLVFYKPNKDFDAEDLAHRVASIIEGDNNLKGINIQIILSQEQVNLAIGKVSWKMSHLWYQKMKIEKWTMAVYRTDLCVAVTAPLAAVEWHESSMP